MKYFHVRNDQIGAKSSEHAGTVVARTKFTRCDVQQGTNMSPEALWRAVVEMVSDVCNGEAGVLEEARSANESRCRQISFWRRCSGSKEPAHQCAWRDVQELGKLSNISYSRRAGEDRLEKLPAVGSRSRKVDSELAQDSALSGVACVSHESAAQLAPAGREPNIDQSSNSAMS